MPVERCNGLLFAAQNDVKLTVKFDQAFAAISCLKCLSGKISSLCLETSQTCLLTDCKVGLGSGFCQLWLACLSVRLAAPGVQSEGDLRH